MSLGGALRAVLVPLLVVLPLWALTAFVSSFERQDFLSSDGDSDGLAAGEELKLRTDPGLDDTDLDGLFDGKEAEYWADLAKRMQDLDPSLFPKDIDPELLKSLLDDPELFKPEGDLDGDGISNILDKDSDNDGIPDGEELANGTLPYFNDSNWNRFLDGPEREYWENVRDEAERHLGDPSVDQDALRDLLSDPSRLSPDGDIDGDGSTNYLDGDADGDGIPDGAELAAGLLPFLLDTDGDGISDGGEPVTGGGGPPPGDDGAERTIPTETTIDTLDPAADLGGTFNVTGRVITPSGRGVGGALVDVFVNRTKEEPGVHAGRGTTDRAGRYALRASMPPDASPGDNQLVAHGVPSAPYLDSWTDPVIQVYSATRLRLLLLATVQKDATIPVAGELLDAGGKAVGAREVSIFFDNRPTGKAVTTGSGSFESVLPAAPLGEHQVYAFFAGERFVGSSADLRTIEVIEGATSLVIREAPETAYRGEFVRATGRLTGSDGRGIPQVPILVALETPAGTLAPTQTATDRTGAWSASLLVPRGTPLGGAELDVTFPGVEAYAGARTRHGLTVLQEGSEVSVETAPRLVRGRDVLRAYLVDAGGEPLAGREVRLGFGGTKLRLVTDAKGSVGFDVPTSFSLGDHAYEVAYEEDLRYAPSRIAGRLTVASSTITQASLDGIALAGDEATFRVTVRDDASNPARAGTLTVRVGDVERQLDLASYGGSVEVPVARDATDELAYVFEFAGTPVLDASGTRGSVEVERPPLVVLGIPASVLFPVGGLVMLGAGGAYGLYERRRREMQKFRDLVAKALAALRGHADTREGVLGAYAEFERWGETTVAGSSAATWTAGERARRLSEKLPERAEDIRRMTDLYERARHGPEAVPPEEREEAVRILERLLCLVDEEGG